MKLLLVRIGRLGDMVMILPAVQALQKRYPRAEFYAVTSSDGARLLTHAGFSPENICVYRNGFFSRIVDKRRVRQFITQNRFDEILCFENKKRTCSWLPDTAKILPPSLQLQHYALRCLQLAGQKDPVWPQTPYLQVNAQKERELADQLLQYGIDSQTILVGLHPSYSGYGKWGRHDERHHRLWDWENYALVAAMLAEYAETQGIKLQVIMDLLPSERQLGLKIQGHSLALLLDWKPDFQRYLCLLKRLNLLITPNTGVMHLAAALDTPVLALFSKHQPQDCGPFMARNRFKVLQAEHFANPQLGLSAIGIEAVVHAAKELIDRS